MPSLSDAKRRIEQTSKFPATVLPAERGVYVVWQPGDGTRYVFLFQEIGGLMEGEGAGKDAVLGTFYTGHNAVSMLFGRGNLVYITYVEDKLSSLSGCDQLAFTVITNWLYGNEKYADETYSEMATEYGFENRLL